MKESNKLAKWLAGEMPESELETFRLSPDFEIYDKIAVHTARLEAPDFDMESMYSEIIKHGKTNGNTIPLQWLVRIAAVLVVSFGILFIINKGNTVSEFAGNEKKNGLLLPDHSGVALNASAEITYKKSGWESHRSLNLKGEAYFKVAKGRTFDVNTRFGKVTVIGTQFNVKASENRFEVSCYEGRVRVQSDNTAVFIGKGEIAIFENGKQLPLLRSIISEPAWVNNQLKFNSQDLNDVFLAVGRQYNILIDKVPGSSKKFTGSVPADNLDTALKIIAKTFGLKYEKTGKSKITILLE